MPTKPLPPRTARGALWHNRPNLSRQTASERGSQLVQMLATRHQDGLDVEAWKRQ